MSINNNNLGVPLPTTEPTTQYFFLQQPPLQSGGTVPPPLKGGLGDGQLTLHAPGFPAGPAVLGPRGGWWIYKNVEPRIQYNLQNNLFAQITIFSYFSLIFGKILAYFVQKYAERSWYDILIPSWLPVGSLPVYPIGAKLDFHAFMGPEGQ